MSKYIIEVDDNAVDGLFKVKGFNTLVFDKNGLDKLQKYEDDTEETAKIRIGDEYFFVGSDGCINCTTYYNDNIDISRMKIGNFFRTKGQAAFVAERLKVLAEMRVFAEPFNTKWDGDNGHYYIDYDIEDKRFDIDSLSVMRCGELYFESYERARECINVVGEDRIKKFYLGVE